MHITEKPYQRPPLHLALAACFAASALAAAPAFADVTSDLKAELAAQRARLEALEKKLEEATREASEAKATANKVAAAAPAASSGSGLSMPKGFAIYGVADAGVEYANYGQGTKLRVQSGMGTASRLGFKGERNFGDDLMAYFQLEAGVSIDNGQNTTHSSNISNPGPNADSAAAPNTTGVSVFSRNTFVGLKGKFGDIRFGRDYTPIYTLGSPTDPFAFGGATALKLWSSAAAQRFDNALYYTSPIFNGIQASVAYSAGMENNTQTNVGVTGGFSSTVPNNNTNGGPKDEGKGWSGNVTYKQGDLFLGAGYLSFFRSGTVTAPATEDVNRVAKNLAASYDFKTFKLYGHYLTGQDTQGGKSGKTLDRNIWWGGISVPYGQAHTFRAVYAHLDDKLAANQDSTHIGLGYEYALDKETDIYAYYARVTNQNGGVNNLCAGGTCQGIDTNLPTNFSPRSLMLGGRYRF